MLKQGKIFKVKINFCMHERSNKNIWLEKDNILMFLTIDSPTKNTFRTLFLYNNKIIFWLFGAKRENFDLWNSFEDFLEPI